MNDTPKRETEMKTNLKCGDSVKFFDLRLVVVEVMEDGWVRCLDADHRIDEYPSDRLVKY